MAPISPVMQELIDEVSIRSMNLDTVKAGSARVASGPGVILANPADFVGAEGARNRKRNQPARRVHHPLCRDGGRSHRHVVHAAVRRMGGSADVPELKENGTSGLVYAVGHAQPRFHLNLGIDTWCPWIALSLRTDLGRFCDEETGARTLRVVSGVKARRDALANRARAGPGRENDAALQLKPTQPEWLE